MSSTPQEFDVITGPEGVNNDKNRQVIRHIWGEPAVKNGQRMKESRYIMTKHMGTTADDTEGVEHLRATGPIKAMGTMQQESDRMDRSVYISANSFINRAVNYDSQTLFSLKNICIDIDDHNSPIEDVCRSANVLLEELFKSHDAFGIPLPNAIVYTGRGLQFWYFLRSTSSKLAFVAQAVTGRLCDQYEALLASMPITFGELSVDRVAATNPAGCFRAPGTYNPKAHCYSQGCLLSSARWDINNLKDAVGVVITKEGPKQTRKSSSDPSRRIHKGDHNPKRVDNSDYARLLLGFLCSLAESGVFSSREVLCHIYHAKLLTYGVPEDEAADKVYALNKLFSVPLRDSVFRSLIRCNQVHHYCYSEAAIFEKLKVPETMVAEYYEKKEALKKQYRRDYQRENRVRDMQSYKKRIAWHNEIRELALQGKSTKEIHEITGRSEPTIRKYIGTPMETMDSFSDRAAAAKDPAPEKTQVAMGDAKLRVKVTSYRSQGFRSDTKIAALLGVDEERVKAISDDLRRDAKAKRGLRSTAYFLRQHMRELDDILNLISSGPHAYLRTWIRDTQKRICRLQDAMDPYLGSDKPLPEALSRESWYIKEQVEKIKADCEDAPIAYTGSRNMFSSVLFHITS